MTRRQVDDKCAGSLADPGNRSSQKAAFDYVQALAAHPSSSLFIRALSDASATSP